MHNCKHVSYVFHVHHLLLHTWATACSNSCSSHAEGVKLRCSVAHAPAVLVTFTLSRCVCDESIQASSGDKFCTNTPHVCLESLLLCNQKHWISLKKTHRLPSNFQNSTLNIKSEFPSVWLLQAFQTQNTVIGYICERSCCWDALNWFSRIIH